MASPVGSLRTGNAMPICTEISPDGIEGRQAIEAFLRRDPFLHLMEIGDLDPFFRAYTRWFALKGAGGAIRALSLLYTAQAPPTLLLFSRDVALAAPFLHTIRHRLPRRFHALLSPGLETALTEDWKLEHHGNHHRMALTEGAVVTAGERRDIVCLDKGDREKLEAFYADSYAENWFTADMLATGRYVGIILEGGRLAAVAGVHVWSPRYRVAVLGNIATRPEFRRQGLATRATAALCAQLRDDGCLVGLNVRTDNTAAIRCYRRLGFETIAPFTMVTASKHLGRATG
jgi:ribosomal protein S18 acetylase RimI-like enzyme